MVIIVPRPLVILLLGTLCGVIFWSAQLPSQLQLLSKVKAYLHPHDFERVIHAFVTSHLDYCNFCTLDLISHRFTACKLLKMQPAGLLTGKKRWILILFVRVVQATRSSRSAEVNEPNALRDSWIPAQKQAHKTPINGTANFLREGYQDPWSF